MFLVLTFILMTIASCPFHGWQSFQAFILGTKMEDDLPYTLERVYTWGSALEMVIGLLAGAALDVFGPAFTSTIGLCRIVQPSIYLYCSSIPLELLLLDPTDGAPYIRAGSSK